MLEYHELADIFPLMEGEEYEQLKEDIRKNGLLEPIYLYQKKILDGRNRYRACKELGIAAKYVVYEGNDPLSFVVSKNIKRRHLNESQRAVIAARIANMKRGNPKFTNRPIGLFKTQTEASKILNVSERTIKRVKQVEREAPELLPEIEKGNLTVHKAIKNIKNKQRMERIKQGDFHPFIYNIWNIQSGDDKDYFGHFPEIFMENLLYYHTKENDLIYDPFAGTGTTIDICKRMGRRYYCSDLKPSRKEIKQWDIADGLPEDLPEVDFVFLDPPYWILAKTEYSENENDLGNVSYNNFIIIFNGFLEKLKEKKISKIAYVIRPIWDTTDSWDWIDPMLDFYVYMHDQYKVEARYVLPYSTQQYNGLWVNRAKERKKPLILNRELIVLRSRYGKI